MRNTRSSFTYSLLFCLIFCISSNCFARSEIRSHEDVLGTWHTDNSRNKPLDFQKTVDSKPTLDDPDWLLERSLKTEQKFDSSLWKQSIDRRIQLNLLIREFDLVGMNREKVHELLGQPEKLFTAENSPDPKRTDLEWYVLSAPRCTIMSAKQPEVMTVFELGFSGDKVSGFRAAVRKTKIGS